MIDCKKARIHIENLYNIKLSPTQYQILKAIIRGDEVYIARRCGRSLLYKGYADYLNKVVSKNTNYNISSEDFDSIFTASMFIKDEFFNKNKFDEIWKTLKEISPECFNRDFECKFEWVRK